MLGEIRAKVEAGQRLDRAEGRWLLSDAPLVRREGGESHMGDEEVRSTVTQLVPREERAHG